MKNKILGFLVGISASALIIFVLPLIIPETSKYLNIGYWQFWALYALFVVYHLFMDIDRDISNE